MKLKLIDLEIERGRDVITVAVPAHEVRVLQAIHGAVKVREAREQKGYEGEFDENVHAEYDRLTRKYLRINAPDPVRLAYPMGPDQLTDFGFDPMTAAKPAPTGLIKDGRSKKSDSKPADEKPAKPGAK